MIEKSDLDFGIGGGKASDHGVGGGGSVKP